MEGKQATLTPREEEYLEHVQRAAAEGVTLSEYCRARGKSVGALYAIRRQLARKGYAQASPSAPPPPPRPRITKKPPFVAVRVAKAPSAAVGGEAVCRLRHPSGWTIECRDWPQASWMSALLNGAGHVAS
jgi:hypothetical protein